MLIEVTALTEEIACLCVKTRESRVESVVRKLRRHCASNISTTANIRICADFVGRARVVHATGLDENLQIDLIQVFRHAKEPSHEVLGRLDHAILRLGPEDGDGLRLREVVEEVAV